MAIERLRHLTSSIRTRLLTAFIAVLVLAVGGTALATRQLLLMRVGERIDAELRQEVEELRRLASAADPATGAPFGGDAARILEVFLSQTIPSTGEVMVTFIDGEPFLRTAQRSPYRIDTDPQLQQLWTGIEESARGTAETPAGPLEYLAVPLRHGDGTEAVFVVAVFRDLVTDDVTEAARIAALAALASVILGSVVAVGLANRILVPLREVTRTTQEISESDLSRRLEVESDDEIGRLAVTFNAMLDRLEAAFGEQQRFLDDAGHELRTPITIVRGHLELLDTADPSDREETVALVIDELDRMHRIVEDLLVLARSERSDFVRAEPLDLGDLTRDVHLKSAALSGSHHFELDETADAVITADQQRLTQAMLQLTANAVQYTPPGTTVRLGSRIDAGQVRLWVRDDGPGIPEADHERIFDRFARGAGPRRSEGVGLGLAIVQAIAEGHGGSVTLHSPPTGGACFTLTIPEPDATAPIRVPEGAIR